MPLSRLEINGYEALRSELELREVAGAGDRLLLLFLADHVDGKSWCPDCVTAEPVIERALAADEIVDSPQLICFISCFVGPKEAWREKQNGFRTSADLNVNCIPTLLEYGKEENRLGDKECAEVEVVKKFILGN